jgi:drug/metabolite transporter (DMT)-like permease
MLGVAVFVGAGGLGEVQAGDVLSLAGAISFGAYAAMIERRGGRVPQRELVATSLTAGTIVLIIGSIPAMLDQDWGLVRAADWLLVLYAATGPILLGFALWAWALQRRGMARTAPFGYLEPLFASMLAIVVLGETFATRQLLGGMLVLTGVVLAAGRHVEPEAPPPL